MHNGPGRHAQSQAECVHNSAGTHAQRPAVSMHFPGGVRIIPYNHTFFYKIYESNHLIFTANATAGKFRGIQSTSQLPFRSWDVLRYHDIAPDIKLV